MVIKAIQKSRILVVDDIRLNQAMMIDMLQSSGFENIDSAMNGSEALEKISSFKPDLILLDLILPDMDGYDICKFVKASHETSGISVIVQSAMTQSDQKQRAFELGANDFINKPIDKVELIARVKSQLEQRALYTKLLEAHNSMSEDLEEARELLYSLLPSQENGDSISSKYHVTLDSVYKPSSALGGDYYNTFEVDDKSFGVYLWDFSGHGVTAAINTIRLNGAMYDHKDHAGKPGEFLTELNERLRKMERKGAYATMFYCVLEPKNRKLRYSYASSPPPILISKKRDSYKLINTREFPLGVVDHYTFKEEEMDVSEWDAIILYSDALIETEDQYGNFKNADDWGKMIVNALRKESSVNATMIKEDIMRHFNENYASRLKDDLTLKVIAF